MDQEVTEPVEAPAVEAPEVTPDLALSQAPESPDGTSTGQSYTVKVGGEEISVSLDEALNGYMRQADYTQKTQALATQREELTYAEQIAQALETNPAAAIQALVAAYDVQDFQPQAKPEVQEPKSPEEEKFARYDQFISQQEQRMFEAQVNADLAEMHQQFGQFNDADVIQYAVTHGIPSIKEATKAFVVDQVYSTAQKQIADRKTQERKAAAPPVAGGHGVAGGATQAGGTAPATSLRAALELAEQSLGVQL